MGHPESIGWDESEPRRSTVLNTYARSGQIRSAPIRLLLLLGLLVGFVASGVSGAEAATYKKLAGKTTSGNVFYGNYNGIGSEKWVCGDPSLGGKYILQPSDGSTTYGAVKTATSWKTKNGSSMSGTEVRTLAHVLAVDADTTNDTKAANADWAVRDLVGNGSGKATPGGSSYASAGKKIIANAKKLAGPYKSDFRVERSPTNTALAYVRGYLLESASGAKLGVKGELTINGPGTFDSNDKKTIATRSDGETIRINATGNGTITVKASYENLPSTKLHYRTPSSSNFQRMLITGKTEDFSASDKVTLRRPVTPPAAPTPTASVTTQSSKNVARPGDFISDRVVFNAITPTPYTGTVTGGLYVTGSGTPGTQVGPTVSWPVNGRNVYFPPRVQIPADAAQGDKYTWRWNFPGYTHANGNIAAFRTPDNVPSETVTIDANFTPAIETRISNDKAEPGSTVTDQVWISDVLYIPAGVDENGEPTPARGWKGTVTAKLYEFAGDDLGDEIGSVTFEADSTDDAHWETNADGSRSVKPSNPYDTPGIQIPETAKPGGKYTFVLSIEQWTDELTGGIQNAITTPAGLVEETSTTPKAKPTYVTQISDQTAALGSTIFDTIDVTGLYEGESIDIKWKVFWSAEKPELTEVCEGDPVYEGTLTVSKNGKHDTPPVLVDQLGFYTYVESHAETDVHESFATKCGEVTETTWVKAQPVFVTQISNQETFVGSKITDDIEVSGLENGKPLDIHWEVYWFAEKPELTDKCVGGERVAEGVETATKNGTITTPEVEVKKAGYYTYVEWSESNETYHAFSTKCGEVTETTITYAQPTYKTKVSNQKIVVGDTIFDTITVKGMAPGSKLNITWELHGPYKEKPTVPTGDVEVSDRCEGKAYATGVVTATEDGDLDTPKVKIEKAGWYTYTEHHEDQGANLHFNTKCGEAEETFLAKKPTIPFTSIPAGGSELGIPLYLILLSLGGVVVAGAVVARRRRSDQA